MNVRFLVFVMIRLEYPPLKSADCKGITVQMVIKIPDKISTDNGSGVLTLENKM